MARTQKSTINKKTVTSKRVSDATIKKAAARDLAICHCKGYMQGCGAVVSRSTRWRHRKREIEKHGKQIRATLLSTSQYFLYRHQLRGSISGVLIIYLQLELLVPTQTEDGLHDVVKCFYAQLHYIIKAILPVHDTLGIQEEFRSLLALVSICDTSGDATRSQVWYNKLKKPQFVHVGTIQCVVGRVKVENRWGIIDTSIEGKRTSFVDS
jgi:hypothetical protein